MADPVADDFNFIRQKLEELEAERAKAKLAACGACFSSGWVMHGMVWLVCPDCNNPTGRTREAFL